jgi:hypothetical protein
VASNAGGLQPADVRGSDDAGQVGVLAEGLLDPAPPVVPHHVQDRREPLVDPAVAHAGADRGSHGLDQAGIVRGGPGQRRGEHGGAVGGEAGEAFLVRDSRDAQPGVVEEVLLQLREFPRGLDRLGRPGTERTGEMPQPILAGLFVAGRRHEDVLPRRHGDAGDGGIAPRTAELRHLLFQRHLGQQQRDALRARKPRIGPRAHAGS